MTPTPPSVPSRRRGLRAYRGFTLIELLIVVAMVGVLAALALVGYRKYILSAQTSEATAMLQNIRVAQESYKSEALSYLPVSPTLSDTYPRAIGALNDGKAAWLGGSAALSSAWATLNVRSEGPVRFGYSCVTGLPSDALPGAAVTGTPDPNWGAAFASGDSPDPWFVAAAIGNRDGDGQYAVLQTASFTTEVLVHDELE
jgi:type IV pilus assembly protein PilA